MRTTVNLRLEMENCGVAHRRDRITGHERKAARSADGHVGPVTQLVQRLFTELTRREGARLRL